MAESIKFRLDENRLQAIDHPAEPTDRDRSSLLNETVNFEVQQWHAEQIRAAILDADAGEFATEEKVRAAFNAFKSAT